MRNPMLSTYWSMGAVRHGDYIAKVRVAPAAENAAQVIHRDLDLTSAPDVFHPTLADELHARAFDFDLQLQLCRGLHAMPVNDLIVEWPEKLSRSSPSDAWSPCAASGDQDGGDHGGHDHAGPGSTPFDDSCGL
ncbi:hypothetical protein AB0K15_33715 [Amycolatopsis sp. NPDC049253]|uniref:hypothetical protein n=1 Tax=Amycolatopsis sp. NPDC049253 TaxID=3155274 RepID=UPI00342E0A06